MSVQLAYGQTAAAKRGGFWSRLVLERSHRLMAIVILLQLIQIFREYWWSETYSIVYAALAVTAVCELLFTRRYAIRLAMEFAAIVLLSALYSPTFQWIGWPSSWKSGLEWQWFFDYHVATLHPFVEIALGVVLALHAIARIGCNRSAMLAILMTAIGVMATFDSFFPLELWHNIAWIVVAGLGWLVILHLHELKARHPDSWEALAERPIELALPAAIVISLLLLSGIFMPRAPALLEDPYTIWSEAQGRDVPSLAGEGGILSGNLGSLGSGGSASSGYGRDDREIGGGFDYDYSPVMTVHTSRRSYWRGETKTVYNGKGWDDAEATMVPLGVGIETNFGKSERPEGVAVEKITQTVEILRKDRLSVLFAAGPASRIAMLEGGEGELMGNREEWELRFRRPARVETYTVESEVTLLDRAALRQASLPAAADQASIDLTPYLQLPDSLPARVADLAEEVTAAGTNEYDKADMLAQYLKNTYPYNNKPDVSKQKSADVTDAFLFEIMEGYCDYYSTAFVVMARTLGIPARWVKGYASGVDPSFEESMRFGGGPPEVDPDGPGSYTVRNADAHSWAEVYFEGYGWIPFEPTAGFSVPQPVPVDAPAPLDIEPSTPELPVETAESQSTSRIVLPIVGAVLLLAVAAVLVLRRRNGAMQWLRRIRYVGSSPDQRIVREMEKLVRFMKRRGMKREAHETMRESFLRWGNKFSSLRPEFDSILQRFEHARYGDVPGGEAEAREFEAAVARLRKAL